MENLEKSQQQLLEHIEEFGMDSIEAIEHTPKGVTVRCVARYYNARIGRTSYTPFLILVSKTFCNNIGLDTPLLVGKKAHFY